MANFEPSKLVAGQALFNEKFQSGEWRMPDVVAMMVANTGSIANPELAALRAREDRAVNAYFPIRQAATDGTARAALHTGARGDSLAQSITWSTFSEPASISITQGDDNVLGFAVQFAATQRNAIFNLMSRLDAWFVAQLVANKTQVNVGGGFGSYDGVTTNDYQVALADERLFFSNVSAMMQNNEYSMGITGIVDSQGGVLANDLQNQGSANDRNTVYQFAGYDQVVVSSRSILDVPTTYKVSGLFFETGLVGVVPWIPQKNRKPLNPEKVMDNVGDFGQITLPGLGLPVAVSAYSTRADASASNGSAQDVVIEYEWSVDVGFVDAPLSTFRGANDTVIYSAGVLAS